MTGASRSAAPDLLRFLELSSAVRWRTPLLIPASLRSTNSSAESLLKEEKSWAVLSPQLHPDAGDDAKEPEIPEQRNSGTRRRMRKHGMLGQLFYGKLLRGCTVVVYGSMQHCRQCVLQAGKNLYYLLLLI
jgi:hypothetical protein